MLSSLFSITLWLSACLLFWVQLMVAKLILPLLGGSPAVWTTCQLFFQVTLLLGYGYAHWLSRWRIHTQGLIHFGMLTLAWVCLPIRIPVGWQPPVETDPIGWVLGLLLISTGLPFFGVSTTAPLLQQWFGRAQQKTDPYVLYAASNLGSLVGLLSYPIGVEPRLTLPQQSWLWAVGYGLLTVGIAWSFGAVVRSPDLDHSQGQSQGEPTDPGRWVVLAFIPSSLLLGVTTYITTDIAAIPLLWAIPLAIYLLTFMAVFAPRPWLPPKGVLALIPGLGLLVLAALQLSLVRPVWVVLPLHLLTFGLVAWVSHAQLVASRPDPSQLTRFYGWVAVGGALGGVFNGILAPLWFQSVLEYPLGVLLAVLLLAGSVDSAVAKSVFFLSVGLLVPLWVVGWDGQGWTDPRHWLGQLLAGAVWAGVTLAQTQRRWILSGVLVVLLINQSVVGTQGGVLESVRSFFGVYRVVDSSDPVPLRRLLHGTTVHGKQNLDPAQQKDPLTYFSRSGPMGQIFAGRKFKQVAVLGLGIGTLAAYSQPGQTWTFYEIDPLVETLARRYFTFLDQASGSVRVVLGDARLSLQQVPPHRYDLMIMDAFSSDAIPVHLITQQALELYLDRLTPHGLLVFNITNRYLNLEPLLAGLSNRLHLVALHRQDDLTDPESKRAGSSASHWVVLAPDPKDVAGLSADPRWQRLQAKPRDPVWTDEFSNLLQILRVQ